MWPTTINGQSLSGSTGTMETQLPSIQVSKYHDSGSGDKKVTDPGMRNYHCYLAYLSFLPVLTSLLMARFVFSDPKLLQDPEKIIPDPGNPDPE